MQRPGITVVLTATITGSAFATSEWTPRFPGASWEQRTPSQVGLDGAKLDEIKALLGGDGCVIYDGYMIKKWGQINVHEDWASAAKPVIGTMLMFAHHEGLIPSVDHTIAHHDWDLIPKDEPITYRGLANNMSGYTREEPNARAWAYNDYGVQLFAKTLFDEVYESWPDSAATAPERLGALQFEDGEVFGSREGYGVLASVRDFARIAWFWLHEGQWDGVQLLPSALFDTFRRPQVPANLAVTDDPHPQGDYLGIDTYGGGSDQTPYGPGIYGFGWWFNGFGPLHEDSRTWPDAPVDAYQANGHWGSEVVAVIPSRRIVLLHRDGTNEGFSPGSSSTLANHVLKLLAEAVRPRPFLTLDRVADQPLLLWTDDCAGDHAIYEGTLGDWYEHTPIQCADSDQAALVPPSAGDRYYLVVPRSASTEGSYGVDSNGQQIPASHAPCAPAQNIGYCP